MEKLFCGKKSKKNLVVVVGVGVAGLMAWLYKRRGVRFDFWNDERYFSFEEIATALLNAEVLGSGGFGVVSKVSIGGVDYAAKTCERLDNQNNMMAFYAEIDMVDLYHHPNLIKVEGFALRALSNKGFIIYELCANGSVFSELGSDSSLTWAQRNLIAKGAAAGLLHLHQAGYIHRDFTAKVGDFGLSIRQAQAGLRTAVVGTRGLIDPEYFATGIVRPSSDVYQFGVFLLELLQGGRPVPVNGRFSVLFVLLDAKLAEWNQPEVNTMIRCAELCLLPQWHARPRMEEVLTMLMAN